MDCQACTTCDGTGRLHFPGGHERACWTCNATGQVKALEPEPVPSEPKVIMCFPEYEDAARALLARDERSFEHPPIGTGLIGRTGNQPGESIEQRASGDGGQQPSIRFIGPPGNPHAAVLDVPPNYEWPKIDLSSHCIDWSKSYPTPYPSTNPLRSPSHAHTIALGITVVVIAASFMAVALWR